MYNNNVNYIENEYWYGSVLFSYNALKYDDVLSSI